MWEVGGSKPSWGAAASCLGPRKSVSRLSDHQESVATNPTITADIGCGKRPDGSVHCIHSPVERAVPDYPQRGGQARAAGCRRRGCTR